MTSNIAYVKANPVKTGVYAVLGILVLGIAAGYIFGFSNPLATHAFSLDDITSNADGGGAPPPDILPPCCGDSSPIFDGGYPGVSPSPDFPTPPEGGGGAPPPDILPPCCDDSTPPTTGIPTTPPPDILPPCCTDSTPPIVTPPPDVLPPCCDTPPVVTPPVVPPPDVLPPCSNCGGNPPIVVPPVTPPGNPPTCLELNPDHPEFCTTPPITTPTCLDLHPGHPEACSPQPPAPSCDAFTGTPSTINSGDAVTLAWKTTNATSITIDQGVGSVTPVAAGSTVVHPLTDTTYTATVSNVTGSVTCTAPVHVTKIPPPPAPSCDAFSGTPSLINPGDAVTLAWKTTNATTITIDNGVGSVTPVPAGSTVVHPLSDTTYTATVANATGSVTCAAPVHVTTTPPPASCDAFTGTPSTINAGDAVTLAWKTSNATSIVIDQGVGSVTPVPAGSTIVHPLVDTVYTATVSNATSHVTCAAPVHVTGIPNNPVPACVLLSADKTTINPGDTVTLTYATSNAVTASIDNGVGNLIPVASGTKTVTPATTTTYTESVAGAPANPSCVVTVTVSTTPPCTENCGGGGGGCTTDCGGGGCSGNCGGGGGGGRHPNVNLAQLLKPGPQGLASISLTQIPYTGLDLGPIGTALYWLMLLLWSAAAAYLVLFGATPFLFRRAKAFGGNVAVALATVTTNDNSHDAHANAHAASHDDHSAHGSTGAHDASHGGHNDHHDDGPSLMQQILIDAGITRPKVEQFAAPVASAPAHRAAAPVAPAPTGFSSYASGPVLSIDDIVKGLSREQAPAPEVHAAPAAPTPVAHEVQPIHQDVPFHQDAPIEAPALTPAPATRMEIQVAAPTMALDAEVPTFIELLLKGDRDAAFGTIRQLNQSGADTEAFMAQMICALDDAYRGRIDGTPVHAEIKRITAHCATPFLERLVTSLTTAVDGSYSMGVTGIKLAITRALAVAAG